MGRDPLAGIATLPLSLNPYAYATDNPVTGVDPSGLSSSRATQDPSCLDWSSSRACALPGVDVSPDGVGVSPMIFKDPCQLRGIFCATDEGGGSNSGGRLGPPLKAPKDIGGYATRSEFGAAIGWSSKEDPVAAASRGALVTPEQIAKLGNPPGSVTADTIRGWRDFYVGETSRNPTNPTAPGRAAYINAILKNLEGG